MTKEPNDPYAGLKNLVWKTKKSSPKPEPRMFSNFGVFVGDREDIEALEFENKELKLLLKESIENFKTKELADRIYKIPGIERPDPEPIKVKEDEEIPY